MTITIRDPGSALTHFIAVLMVCFGAVPLLAKAAMESPRALTAMTVFVVSLILLYSASTTYHSVNLTGRALRIFRKIDHMMIFVLIAGSYTPVALCVLEPEAGIPLLITVWSIAGAGMILKLCWVTCPKWFSSVIYIALGWSIVPVMGKVVRNISAPAFGWLLAGGIIYTLGGILYALKLKAFNTRHRYFGSHEIFHLFVMGGSFCHFIFMLQYVL